MKDVTPKKWHYSAPENKVLYAVGDLHGHLQTHEKLYSLLKKEAENAPEKEHIIIYLGDYIDRGPESAQLIERLRLIKSPCLQHVFLMGNHEAGLLGFLENPYSYASWLEYGGIETAQSYGCNINKRAVLPHEIEEFHKELKDLVPQTHLDFLNSLDYISLYGDYAFVHAGIKPGTPLNEQNPQDLRFIREEFLQWKAPHEKCIVHGHTITKQPEIKPNRINLDTGLYQNHILTCGVFKNNTVKILQINENN